MTLLFFILLYLVGCLLSYWRILAAFGKDAKQTTVKGFLKYEWHFPLIVTLFSWIGFVSGTAAFFKYNSPYFFKFHVKDYR